MGLGPDNKRIRKWHAGYRTKRDAERARIELLASVQSGTYVEPSKLDVRGFLQDRWLPAMRGRVRPLTIAIYRVNITNHLVPTLGHIPLQKLEPDHLDGLYAALAADKHLGPGTIRSVHVTAHRALQDAVRWGKVPRNVASLASPPRRQRTEMQTWSADEVRAFLEHVREDRLYALWVLAATSGMRRGELLAARWGRGRPRRRAPVGRRVQDGRGSPVGRA